MTNIDTGTLGTLGTWALIFGTFAAFFATAVLVRWCRTGKPHERTSTIAVAMVNAFTAEGMWEVARQTLDLDPIKAFALFAVFEFVMLNQGLTARFKINALKVNPALKLNPIRNLTFVWAVAVASGLITATAANSATEIGLRIVTPIVGAALWWTSLTADRERSDDAITWLWTPTRIGVKLGIIRAGKQDTLTLSREAQVKAIAEVGFKLAVNPTSRLRARRLRKLQRLALEARPAVLADAAAQVELATNALHLIVGTPGAEPNPPKPPKPPKGSGRANPRPSWVPEPPNPDWFDTEPDGSEVPVSPAPQGSGTEPEPEPEGSATVPPTEPATEPEHIRVLRARHALRLEAVRAALPDWRTRPILIGDTIKDTRVPGTGTKSTRLEILKVMVWDRDHPTITV